MSDLTATNCGCGCDGTSNNSIIWIILLLCCCGGCGNNGNAFGGDSCLLLRWLRQ